MIKFYAVAAAGIMLTGCHPKTAPSKGKIQETRL